MFTKTSIDYFNDICNSSTTNFVFAMYNRFVTDCRYYLGNGTRNPKHLWTKNPYTHIETMELMAEYITKNNLGEIDLEELENFKKEMIPNNFYSNFSYFEFNDDDSFTCIPSEEALNCLETKNMLISLLWETSLDFVLAGEDGCISNYDMYTPIYNYKNNKLYLVPHSVANNWSKFDIVTIYPTEMDEDTKKEVMEFIENN